LREKGTSAGGSGKKNSAREHAEEGKRGPFDRGCKRREIVKKEALKSKAKKRSNRFAGGGVLSR